MYHFNHKLHEPTEYFGHFVKSYLMTFVLEDRLIARPTKRNKSKQLAQIAHSRQVYLNEINARIAPLAQMMVSTIGRKPMPSELPRIECPEIAARFDALLDEAVAAKYPAASATTTAQWDPWEFIGLNG
jgi:hypothetical protein